MTLWINLQGIMVSEISQTKKNKDYDLTYMWNVKKQN